MSEPGYFAHESAIVDSGARIGDGTKIWHFCHVMSGAKVGKGCVFGQNVYVGNVKIGDNVKVQNNVSIYDGVVLDDHVFCGPSMVFTNVMNPRSEVSRKSEFRETLVGRGASIGANATIICGMTVGSYAFVGAGAVVRVDVPAHALVVGVPAKQVGWMCRCGERLSPDLACAVCGDAYREEDGQLCRIIGGVRPPVGSY